MTINPTFSKLAAVSLPAGVEIVGSRNGLRNLDTNERAAVIWNRELNEGFQEWINALPPERLPQTRIILDPATVSRALRDVMDTARTPEGPERNWLIDDITALARDFAAFMDAPRIRLRLDVVSHNACRKFHVDAVRARLICTYRGTATQLGTAQEGSDPVPYQTQAGSPVTLRGTLWPERPATQLLHRSPPIEGTGETRLLLVLDPIFDPESAV